MKKITKLSELKKLDKVELLDEMMKGTIKGGSSSGLGVPATMDSESTLVRGLPVSDSEG